MSNTVTYVTSATRSSYDTVTLVSTDASGNTYTSTFPLNDANGLAAPAAPVPTTATTGGTVLAGVYQVEVSYVDANGETSGSASGPITTTGSTSTITIPSPAQPNDAATGWYAYVSQAGGTVLTRQQTAGTPTAIGTGLTLTAPPTSSGLNPQSVSTAGYKPVTMLAKALTAS